MMTTGIFVAAAILASSLPSIATMKWERRILVVCAQDEDSAELRQQRRFLARWDAGADERDLTVVELVGDKVVGASDSADRLRRRYGIATNAFAVILIGKDGDIKLREAEPITADTLESTIDAMPMRRGGSSQDPRGSVI